MDIDTNTTPSEPVPEVEIYLRLLIIYNLLSSPEANSKALQLAKETGEKILQLNRRSMDTIAAKVWYAVDRAYELGGELADARPYVVAFGFERTRAHSILDYCFLHSAPPHSDTMMNLRPPSSTVSSETTSITVSSTKLINWSQKRRSQAVLATANSLATTTTSAASKSFNSITPRHIVISNKPFDVPPNRERHLGFIKPYTNSSSSWNCSWVISRIGLCSDILFWRER